MTDFEALVARAQSCRLCPRMEGRRRVLSAANGDPYARVVFVAEAPGRLGAERTGIPLTDDQTGRNFDALVAAAHIRRESVFVTNAVLCNPRSADSRNAPPSPTELRNCSPHLAATLEIIQPPYIVALGNAALRALHLIQPHTITLAKDVAQPVAWHGRVIVPLYHPGARARIHRPLALQIADFQRLAELLADYLE